MAISTSTGKAVEWILRVAVFGEFLGHGVLAVQGKQQWIGWIEQIVGVNTETATTLLLAIGLMDIVFAFCVLLVDRLPKAILIWLVIWALWTAILRPMVGEPIWDFIERSANWGAPLALLWLRGCPKNARECFRA